MYLEKEDLIKNSINNISNIDIVYLPNDKKDLLSKTYENALLTFELVQNLKIEEEKLIEYSKDYKSLHQKVRKMQKYIKHIYTRCKAVAPLPVCRLISQPLAIKALTTGSFAFF